MTHLHTINEDDGHWLRSTMAYMLNSLCNKFMEAMILTHPCTEM